MNSAVATLMCQELGYTQFTCMLDNHAATYSLQLHDTQLCIIVPSTTLYVRQPALLQLFAIT